MTTYIVRRILASLPVIFGILVAVFVITRLLPGDPCRALLGEKATEAACSAFDARYGFDQPIPLQFVKYLQNVVSGDLGESIRFGVPVTELIFDRLPTTIELAAISLTIATFFGIKLGVRSATKRNSRTDVSTMIFANLGVSIPVFVLGLLLAYLFAVVLKGTPIALPPANRYTAGVIPTEIAVAWGLAGLQGPIRGLLDFISNMAIPNAILTLNPGNLIDAVKHLILPSVALATIPMAVIARITRYPDAHRTAMAVVTKRLDLERPVEMACETAIARYSLPVEFGAEALREAEAHGERIDPATRLRSVADRHGPDSPSVRMLVANVNRLGAQPDTRSLVEILSSTTSTA